MSLGWGLRVGFRGGGRGGFSLESQRKGEGVGEGTGKGTGKSMRKLCQNYPLATYPLKSARCLQKQMNANKREQTLTNADFRLFEKGPKTRANADKREQMQNQSTTPNILKPRSGRLRKVHRHFLKVFHRPKSAKRITARICRVGHTSKTIVGKLVFRTFFCP